MNQLYRVIRITKQAFHKRMDRYLQGQDERAQLLSVIREIRKENPEMGAREMYFIIKPKCMGRDKFEVFCFENGLRVPRKRSFVRTTNSLGVTRFENFLIGFELTTVNQVWVSDITYYEIQGQFYYLTFIMDLHSRYIVGYSVSRNLLTECTTIPALEMAIKDRHIKPGLIFHSDGGGQYYCKGFKSLTEQHRIRNSMGKTPYENPNAERINGTIKNGYLRHYAPNSYLKLIQETKRAVINYHRRPHSSLKRLSPKAFEDSLKTNVEICTSRINRGNLKMIA